MKPLANLLVHLPVFDVPSPLFVCVFFSIYVLFRCRLALYIHKQNQFFYVLPAPPEGSR